MKMKTFIPDQFCIYKAAKRVHQELQLFALDTDSDSDSDMAEMQPPLDLRMVQPLVNVVDALLEMAQGQEDAVPALAGVPEAGVPDAAAEQTEEDELQPMQEDDVDVMIVEDLPDEVMQNEENDQ